MKILFASNSSFGEIVLQKIIKEGVKPSLLVVSCDKRTKRSKKIKESPLRRAAIQEKIPLFEIKDKDDFHRIVKENSPDIAITAGFGIIIPEDTLSLSSFLNVHPSLLPFHRGPSPIQSAILNGVTRSGVTIIKMETKFDRGPIIKQKEVSLPPKVYYTEAEKILGEKGGELLVNAIVSFFQGKSNSLRQEENVATYTKMIKKEDGKINWEDSADNIEKKVRAFASWPGAFCKMEDGKVLKILEAEVQEQTGDGPFGEPGKVYLGTNDTIAVQTGKDFLLISNLQVEGKNPVKTKDFLQGNMDIIGTTFK